MRRFDVLVASHGSLASAMLDAAHMICGDHSGATTIGLEPDESPEGFAVRLAAAVKPGWPTLLLTDLFGGTPHNVACTLARRSEAIRCIAGLNLGLLIEAITCDDELDNALVERLVASARDAMVDVSARLASLPARPAEHRLWREGEGSQLKPGRWRRRGSGRDQGDRERD